MPATAMCSTHGGRRKSCPTKAARRHCCRRAASFLSHRRGLCMQTCNITSVQHCNRSESLRVACFSGGSQDQTIEGLANACPVRTKRSEYRSHAGNDTCSFGDKQHAERANHGQPPSHGDFPRNAVIENHLVCRYFFSQHYRLAFA